MRCRDLAVVMPVICLFASGAIAQEGDAAAGATVFKKCAVCHIADTDKNKVGPSLNHLFGRKAGTHPNFAYSPAMKAAGKAASSGTRRRCVIICTIQS
jgi:cytochrome c